MSLTNATKDYWINEVNSVIKEKAREYLRSVNNPNLIDELKEQAYITFIKEKKIQNDVITLDNTKREIKSLEESLQKAREKERKLINTIKDKCDLQFYGYRGDVFYEIKEKASKALLENLLSEHKFGKRYLEIINSQKRIERAIMLASSPTKLRDALSKFFGENGIKDFDDLVI